MFETLLKQYRDQQQTDEQVIAIGMAAEQLEHNLAFQSIFADLERALVRSIASIEFMAADAKDQRKETTHLHVLQNVRKLIVMAIDDAKAQKMKRELELSAKSS
jgi:predicted TIM-barrel fold metal-dependent hydrolase